MNFDYQKYAEEQKIKRETIIRDARTRLLKEFRNLGIKEVYAEYDGYGDSGNIEVIQLSPETKLDPTLESKLTNFLWSVAYNEHPGFEINEGADGQLFWNIGKNVINLDHNSRFVDTIHTFSEDI